MKDKYVLTAESVTEGHPDKLCDTIADAVVDACLEHDPTAHVACEVMATAGKIIAAGANKIKDGKALLASGDFNKCAVANPKLAPYGLAAHETLKSLKLFDKVSPKFVEGDNIGKTFNFVKTANADIGFVALSQVYKNGKITSGSGWIVPAELYGKIAQDAVLLKQGKNQDAAKEFLKFLQGQEAAKVKLDYGYGDK